MIFSIKILFLRNKGLLSEIPVCIILKDSILLDGGAFLARTDKSLNVKLTFPYFKNLYILL